MVLQTYSVNRSPFSVPDFLDVISSEGVSAFQDVIRASAKHSVLRSLSTSDDPSRRPEKKFFLVRKYPNVLGSHRTMRILGRVLSLHAVLPADAPNILPVVAAYSDSSRREDIYCVTPAMSMTLAEALRNPAAFTRAHALFVVGEVAQAVQYLHRSSICVGDIRPESVLVNSNLATKNSVVIADFTVCHLATESIDTLRLLDANAAPTKEETISCPQLCYRAPEWVLYFGEAVGTEADVWSLGCLLLESLTGRPLFFCPSNSVNEYVNKLTEALPVPEDLSFIKNSVAREVLAAVAQTKRPSGLAGLLGGATPRHLLLLVKRMLVINPAKRITIDEFIAALQVHTANGINASALATTEIKGSAKSSLPVPPGWIELGAPSATTETLVEWVYKHVQSLH
jgi:serine/threonine protein kinase